MSRKKYDLAIERLIEQYESELLEEEVSTINNSEYQVEEESVNQNEISLYSLSELTYDGIQHLKVSQVSFFMDVIWDWRQEGSPIYKNTTYFSWNKDVSDGVSLLDKENMYLCYLLKMIAFYSLPQNACLQNIKSFNTSKQLLEQSMLLGKFLYKNRLFVDIQGNGNFTNAIYLRKEHFAEYLEQDLKEPYFKYAFSKQVKNWRALSQNNLIPVQYRLDFDPFDDNVYSQLAIDLEKSKGVYLPISLDTLSELVPRCMDTIEQYSNDILRIYDVLWPFIAGGKVLKEGKYDWSNAINDLFSIKSKIFNIDEYKFKNYSEVKISTPALTKLQKAIVNHPDRCKETPVYFKYSPTNKYKLLKTAVELGMDVEMIDKTIMYDLVKIKNEAINFVTELRNSCVVILFLVTGMRNSEMYLLEAGDCWQAKGSEDDFRIKITVSKTSEASSGDSVELPVPEIAYKAFKCLEALTEQARIWGKSNKLMVSPTSSFGKEIWASSINQFLGRWCEDLGIEHIHPHRFRKTIAMFAIYQNSNNIGIIRRLFSHKSLAMTLAYIIKMPGMNEEIKLATIEQNKQLLSELLEAIDKKRIGGKAGNRIKSTLGESKMFKANLNDDGWESLEQYVEILLQDGLKILHRTSFGAICTNTHSGLVHLGPETCSCNVVDCDWAVFTENSIEDLENDIKFHMNLLAKDLSSGEQKRFSKAYIKNCIERLCELKGRDVVSEQFPELMNTGA